MRRTPRSPLFPYTTLFRSSSSCSTVVRENCGAVAVWVRVDQIEGLIVGIDAQYGQDWSKDFFVVDRHIDRKSTRLNSSHVSISYAVFCLKKKIHVNFILM